jgi:hypothetical protein
VFYHDGPADDTKLVSETVRQEALKMLRCASQELGLVNGLGVFGQTDEMPRHGVCIANMDRIDGEPRFKLYSLIKLGQDCWVWQDASTELTWDENGVDADH